MTKILVADDEPDITDVMVKRLQKEGFDVYKAYNGQEAIDKIKENCPDVVLLDVNMPDKDGFSVLRELRQNPPTAKRIAVVMISARDQLEDIREGFDLEADHYITKPCQMRDVLKAIQITSGLADHYQ